MKSQLSAPLRLSRHFACSLALGASALIASGASVHAIISVPGPITYTQTFDALGSTTAPWVDDSTIPGWIVGINSNNTPDGDLRVADGADAGALAGLLNLGSVGAGERALGSKATTSGNAANIAFGVVFRNTSSQPLVLTGVTYTGELWRTNATAAGLAEQWFLFYKTSSSPITDVEPGTSADAANPGSFTPFPAVDWSSPTNLPAASPLDGNAAANRITLTGNPNVIINPGDYLMVRWVDTNRSGTDGYQAIDDVSITFGPAFGTNLANISTRLRVETGDNVLIGGFIVSGTQPKKVLVRGIGPALPLAGQLADPTLELYDGSNRLLRTNDNWQDAPNKQEIIDSGLAPTNSLESAILLTLPANSNYTAILRGTNNGTGIGVVEAYDLDRSVDSKLANISTRGLVQTGDNVLIAGTIVQGQAAQMVVIRAIGPSLPVPGKLANPTLELRDSNGALLQENDNWPDSPNKQAIIDAALAPGNDLESAILATVPANASYTAIVRGANNGTGIAVVEVYAIPSAPAGTAAITSPANNASVGSAFMIDATVTPPAGGTIASVWFYDGATLLGTDYSSPFRFTWTSASVGSHALKVVAYDGSNNPTATSAVVNVNVVAGAGTLTRGPYLQKGAPTQMTIRWRNTLYDLGRVRYGATPATLNQTVDEAALPTGQLDHVVTLTGLTPNTTYYYSIGSGGDTLAPAPADNAADFTFTTPPTAGTAIDTRVWVLGDAGTANSNQRAVRDAFYTFTGARTPNVVLQLGDNAYNSGLDNEFQNAMFDIYPTMLRKTVFWSCLGNHETAQSTAFVDTYPYFDIYTLPIAGEAGGVASGSEHYYSFDYGNIHFISLDSMTADRSVDDPGTPANEDGPMAAWLKNDLQSTTATWIIAFFHHPPYTKGSHNSDTESEHVAMRQNFIPILEAGGVDLTLGGHSHIYERSFLLDGHYSFSATLTPAMKLDGGDGRPGGTGAYMKPLAGAGGHKGAVHAVAGSAGQLGGTQPDGPHPAHFISLTNLGSLVLDINGNRLDATFVRENGSAPDTFTIMKQ